MQDGACCRQPRWERRIGVTGSGYWLSPRAGDCGGQSRNATLRRIREGGDVMLSSLIKHCRPYWPTPKGSPEKFGKPRENDRGDLQAAVRGGPSTRRTYPTPTNSMVTTGDQEQARFSGSDPKRPAYADANKTYPTPRTCAGLRSSGMNRTEFYRAWGTPSAHPRTGAPRQVDHGVQLANQVGGQLNPAWVAWLMGWTIGWTALEPLATDRFRRWLRLFGGC